MGALPCPEILEASGLLNETPGAPLPPSDSAGDWIAFGDKQTGQLDKANGDKRGVRGIVALCKRKQAEADAAAKPRHWWQFYR